jgi:hypothetical protein
LALPSPATDKLPTTPKKEFNMSNDMIPCRVFSVSYRVDTTCTGHSPFVFAELQAAEIVAEESGDEAAIVRAMDASDAWCERTEALRVRLYGRGGWPQ